MNKIKEIRVVEKYDYADHFIETTIVRDESGQLHLPVHDIFVLFELNSMDETEKLLETNFSGLSLGKMVENGNIYPIETVFIALSRISEWSDKIATPLQSSTLVHLLGKWGAFQQKVLSPSLDLDMAIIACHRENLLDGRSAQFSMLPKFDCPRRAYFFDGTSLSYPVLSITEPEKAKNAKVLGEKLVAIKEITLPVQIWVLEDGEVVDIANLGEIEWSWVHTGFSATSQRLFSIAGKEYMGSTQKHVGNIFEYTDMFFANNSSTNITSYWPRVEDDGFGVSVDVKTLYNVTIPKQLVGKIKAELASLSSTPSSDSIFLTEMLSCQTHEEVAVEVSVMSKIAFVYPVEESIVATLFQQHEIKANEILVFLNDNGAKISFAND